MKQFFLNLDICLGKYFPLSHTAYTEETILTSAGGVYSQEEWVLARSKGYNDSGENLSALNSADSYYNRAYSIESRKLISALRLTRNFDFSRINTVLEVGCGEMITSLAIKTAFPHLSYTASDFDQSIINKCKSLPCLDKVDKAIVDIRRLQVADLKNVDLILSWDVFYAFSDEELFSFFKILAQSNTKCVMCTSQLIGPLRFLSFKLRDHLGLLVGKGYKNLAAKGIIRDHGFKRTVRKFMSMAKTMSIDVELVGFPSMERSFGDSYSFVFLNPPAESVFP